MKLQDVESLECESHDVWLVLFELVEQISPSKDYTVSAQGALRKD